MEDITDDIAPEQALPTEAAPAQVIPKAKARPPVRKYLWHGMQPTDPRIYNDYGGVKIRPWSMTDDEIDKLLLTHPHLRRLWQLSEEVSR